MLFEKKQSGGSRARQADGPRGIVDGLVVGDREIWVIVAPHGEPLDEWLDEGDAWGATPLMVCRDVIDGEVVVIDTPDPFQLGELSEIEDLL